MTRRSIICAMTALAAVVGGSASAQNVELRFAHWLPPQHPLHLTGFEPWAESIAEASGGSLTITFFPAQQLGAAGDHYDMARDGIADIAFVNPGYQPGRFPIIAAGELPFLISNAREGSVALDAWYRTYVEEEMPDVKFCMAHFHDPGTFHSRQPISHPDDVAGMTVRPAHATMAAFISELGGQNTQVSAPEARDALERGVADAITFPWNSILVFGIENAVNYHFDLPLYATTFVWVMNRGSYDRLSDEHKAIIDEHCSNDWVERAVSGWVEEEERGRETLLGREGHERIEPTEEEVAAWQERAAVLRERWAEGVAATGHDPDEVLNALIEELEARGAAF